LGDELFGFSESLGQIHGAIKETVKAGAVGGKTKLCLRFSDLLGGEFTALKIYCFLAGEEAHAAVAAWPKDALHHLRL